MNKDLGKLGRPAGSDFPPYTFPKVENSGPNCESPTFVPKAVLRRVEGKARDIVRVRGITYETSRGVRIQGDHEEKGKMMCVPERLKALVTDLPMSSCVHQDHDKEHEMAGNAARLSVVNLKSCHWPNFCGVT